MKQVVLAIILLGLLILGYMMFDVVRWITWGLLILAGIALFFILFVRKYDETERAIIYRMGRFNRIAGPGWSIVIPFFEKEFQKIDVRTKILPININKAFTAEDLQINLNGSVYYKIRDPEKAILKIENYLKGLKDLIVSETRNIIASMSLRQLFANLDQLNDILADQIRHATWNWGIDVPMVQIQYIEPAPEIVKAMQQKTISSQQLQAAKFRAEAKKILLEAIGDAAKKLDDRAIMYLYLKALEEIGKSSSTKLVIPSGLDNLSKGLGFGAGMSIGGMDTKEIINAIKDRILSSK